MSAPNHTWDFEKGPFSLVGRHLFLRSVQDYTDFFRQLHELWLARDVPAAWRWVKERRVTDDWLIDTIADTLDFWERHPQSPAARLEAGVSWFFVNRPEAVPPDFQPVLDEPYPRKSSRAAQLSAEKVALELSAGGYDRLRQVMAPESIEQFQQRMRKQFNSQLAEYCQTIRIGWDYQSSPELLMHARWTALHWAGQSCGEIARTWKPLHRTTRTGPAYREPVSAVQKAVRRFSERIGLTCPRPNVAETVETSSQKRAYPSENEDSSQSD